MATRENGPAFQDAVHEQSHTAKMARVTSLSGGDIRVGALIYCQ
jgi:hypothetical protein